MLNPGGVSRGRGCVGWLVGVTGRLRDLLKVTSLWDPGLKVERVSKLFGVKGLLGVLGVWVLLPGLLGDWVRPITRDVDLGLSKGRPTPQGLPDRLPAGDWGLESRLVRGRVSGSVLWRRGVWSRLLCGLLALRVVNFPTSASLARSFSTSGGKKGGNTLSQNPMSTHTVTEWVDMVYSRHNPPNTHILKQEYLNSIYIYTMSAKLC